MKDKVTCSTMTCRSVMAAKLLVIIGAINWGLVALFNFNLVTFAFGHFPMVEKIVYILVGVAGLFLLFGLTKCCCKMKKE